MRALVTGAGGQLARELEAARPEGVELTALEEGELDVTDAASVAASVARIDPEVIVNAAAYTAVDSAESEEETARRVNVDGVAHLAKAAARAGARLLHVSTDFVFDGRARRPYAPSDPTGPLSAYGRGKLAGERRALEILAGHAVVVRTSWLYSSRGRNFVTTMLRLMRERDELSVVDDQTGSPTWAAGLADVLWRFAARADLRGVWHWADEGACTWFSFARAIQDEALARGLLAERIPLRPIAAADYPTAAARPAYSVLDASATRRELALEARPWRAALGRMLDEMARDRERSPASTPDPGRG